MRRCLYLKLLKFLLCLLILFFLGCSSLNPPVQQIDDAKKALDAAKSAGVSDEILSNVQNKIREAESLKSGNANVCKALELAVSAKSEAEIATIKIENKNEIEKLKAEIEELKSKVNIDENRAELEKVNKKLEEVKNELNVLLSQLSDL